MEFAIETRGLARRFGDFVAVEGLDLEVPSGTFFGFLAPNGAGKSTTIKMLTGLLPRSAGDMRLLGLDPATDALAIKRSIGVIPEDPILYDRLSGAEYLTFVGRMYGVDEKDLVRRREELLELMGLQEHRHKLVVDYSHGMQKKLALAAALIHGPRLLFLDEPFEGIDAVSSRMIKNLLARLVEGGMTIFLTSHILEVVEKLCTHVAIIERGRLVSQGALDDLRRGSDGSAEARSLEEIFLGLVEGQETTAGELSWLG